MTIYNWGGSYSDLSSAAQYPKNGGTAPGPGDEIIMRRGSAYLTGKSMMSTTIWDGLYSNGPLSDPTTLFLNNAVAAVNLGGNPAVDGSAIYGTRLSEYAITGDSGLLIYNYSPGQSNAHILVGQNSNVTLIQNTSFATQMKIEGSGTLANLWSSLWVADDTINLNVIGSGAWSETSNTTLRFLHGVSGGQSIYLGGDTTDHLLIYDTPNFHGFINVANGASPEITLGGINVTSADFGRGVLMLHTAGGSTDFIPIDEHRNSADMWKLDSGGVMITFNGQGAGDVPSTATHLSHYTVPVWAT